MVRKLLARLLFCDVYDLDNVLLHIPVGAVNALLCLVSGELCVIFGAGFLAYEIVQRKVTKDKAYTDIQGWLWGIALAGIIIWFIGTINGI